MIQFTRTHQTGGLQIREEHVTKDEIFSIPYLDRYFTIGTEPYSLTINPHSARNDEWRVEGLRNNKEIEIWFIGRFEVCIADFNRIERRIRAEGHLINEPEGFDMQLAFRSHWKQVLDVLYPCNPLGSLAREREIKILKEVERKGSVSLCLNEITEVYEDLEEYGMLKAEREDDGSMLRIVKGYRYSLTYQGEVYLLKHG